MATFLCHFQEAQNLEPIYIDFLTSLDIEAKTGDMLIYANWMQINTTLDLLEIMLFCQEVSGKFWNLLPKRNIKIE